MIGFFRFFRLGLFSFCSKYSVLQDSVKFSVSYPWRLFINELSSFNSFSVSDVQWWFDVSVSSTTQVLHIVPLSVSDLQITSLCGFDSLWQSHETVSFFSCTVSTGHSSSWPWWRLSLHELSASFSHFSNTSPNRSIIPVSYTHLTLPTTPYV